jgi:O-antigen ligase
MTIIRVGICVLIAFAVLAHGAVEPWSQAILETGAAALFLWWSVLLVTRKTPEISWSPLLWPLLGLVLLGLLQFLVPLSVNPNLTRMELLRVAVYLLLFFLFSQAFQTARHWAGFTWFLILLGFSVAVFAILQDLTSNGKLYWFRELRFGGIPFGPFVNRNHFAGLMELLIPIGLAILAVRGVAKQMLPMVALCTALPMGALFLSASRGGIVAFGCEILLLVGLLWLRRGEKRQLLTFIAAIVLAGGLVGWLGVDQVLKRFTAIHNVEVTESRRVSMMRGGWHIFMDNLWTGTGLGTTISVYPRYETLYDGKIVDHVHNDHLEVLAETGIVGGICWLAFLGLTFGIGLKNLSIRNEPLTHAVQFGALVACGGLLVHGFVDFNLHIPSNALLFYLLAGISAANPLPDSQN